MTTENTLAADLVDKRRGLMPEGFRYKEDIINEAEEAALARALATLDLKPFEFHGYLGKRRIFTFGHKYVFAGQERRADASIPDYFRPLTDIASRISGTNRSLKE